VKRRYYSEVTPVKHKTYTIALTEILRVNSLIFKKWRWNTWSRPFIYWDLCAGYGREEDGKYGSPLIFLDTVHHHPNFQAQYLKEMKFVCRFIDKDREVCEELKKNLDQYFSEHLEFSRDQFDIKIIHGNYIDFVTNYVQEESKKNQRYLPTQRGLVYIDPNGMIKMVYGKDNEDDENEIADFRPAALPELFKIKRFKKVDLLMNLPVNTIKRCRGVSKGGKLSGSKFDYKNYHLGKNILNKLHKDYMCNRFTYGIHQWVMFICTNMPNMDEFENAGFYSQKTEKGKAIYLLSEYTKEQIRKMDLDDFISKQELDDYKEMLDEHLKNMEMEDNEEEDIEMGMGTMEEI